MNLSTWSECSRSLVRENKGDDAVDTYELFRINEERRQVSPMHK